MEDEKSSDDSPAKNPRSTRGGICRRRQREEKRRALARLAFRPDFAAVRLHDVFHDGKPQPRAALVARTRLVHAVEPFKHAVERFRRNARTVVDRKSTRLNS